MRGGGERMLARGDSFGELGVGTLDLALLYCSLLDL